MWKRMETRETITYLETSGSPIKGAGEQTGRDGRDGTARYKSYYK